MTKQNILDTIEDNIVKNDDGLITAEIVKSILEGIVTLLPSTDSEGSVVIKSVVKDYLTSGEDITLSVTDAGKLEIAFTGTIPDQLTGAEIRNEVFGSVEGGDEITVTTTPEGKLVISVEKEILSKAEIEQLFKTQIEVTSPINKTFDDTSKKLTLSLGGYDPNPAFNNSAYLNDFITSIGLYTPQEYNQALYDSFNINDQSFMLPPAAAEQQGILINFIDEDRGFLKYLETGLVVSIIQLGLPRPTPHRIISGGITAINQVRENIFYMAVDISDSNIGGIRNDIIADDKQLFCFDVDNKISKLLRNNSKDDVARENAITAINEARTAETAANLARTEAAAVKLTADFSLARTQRLTHITPWMYDGSSRTVYIQWKPVKGLVSGNRVTIRIEGITKTYTLTEGLTANDSHGLLIPFNATTSDAANILRNAVNARSGYLLCSVEDTTNSTTDYCWIPVVPSMTWTELTGSSPYTISGHYNEFLIEFGSGSDKVFTSFVNRVQIPTTNKTFLVDTERPDGSHVAELGVILSLNTNTLTATIRQQDTSNGTYSIQKIYAR